jgi:hypothetical protein
MVFSRAARAVWGDLIKEYFNVDSSGDMNDLASLLLRGGSEEMEMPIKGVFYRQFLPASQTVCLYSHRSFMFNVIVYKSGNSLFAISAHCHSTKCK